MYPREALKAMQAAIGANLGASGVRIVDTARSYVFLGDPLSTLKHARGVPTDLPGVVMQAPQLGLIQNAPNPFNPTTRIVFATTRRGT